VDLDKVNRWLSLSANLGVIVGIVFLAMEIQENTKATQAASIQAASELDQEHLLMMGADPELAQLWRTYFYGSPDDLSEAESLQGQYIFAALVRRLNNVYLQYELGALSEQSWKSRQDLFRNVARSPGFETFLTTQVASSTNQEFLDYLRSLRSDEK